MAQNSFYITFEYGNCSRIQEKDKRLAEYLTSRIKRASIEKYTETNVRTNCGIAMRLEGDIKHIERCVDRISSRFDFISAIRIRYPRG